MLITQACYSKSSGHAPIVEWSKMVPLTAYCLTAVRIHMVAGDKVGNDSGLSGVFPDTLVLHTFDIRLAMIWSQYGR